MDERIGIVAVPLLLLAIGIWVHRETRNDVWMQMEQAQENWRQGRLDRAAEIYQSIAEGYPDSRYAPDALWELAALHYLRPDQIEKAVRRYQQLAARYPDSPRAKPARFREAEIHAKDLDDIPRAVSIWNELLLDDSLDQDLKRQTQFQLGTAHFRADEFDEALASLLPILASSPQDALTQQALVFVGTIHQIQGRYQQSADVLDDILKVQACCDCRLQARLLLIQNYEFLGDLPRAIQTAKAIDTQGFSPQRKIDLIERLEYKRKFDKP